MPMFGFDEQYPFFDVTPVDNQFILEYLPTATGDAVRVYLYGLMQCYHPAAAMSLEQMARELGMESEAVLAAFRHWERKGLVRRVKDNPPTYQYISVKNAVFVGGAAPADPEYEAFAAAVYGIFGNDRRLHGGEISRIYEWVEEMRLPQEVVLALVRHMVKTNGKNVSVKTMEKRATQLAEEKVATAEDAVCVLERDRAVFDGAKAVVRRMGKRRDPSEDETDLYRKWTVDWRFTREDVLAACVETTKGDPNFKYLDGILSRLHTKRSETGRVQKVADAFAEEKDAAAPLKALLMALNLPTAAVNEGTLRVYADMRALYPDNIIMMAGRECSRHGVTKLDDVMNTLHSWKRSGLKDAEDVRLFMQKVDDQNAFLRVLYEVTGMAEAKPNAADRRLLARWLDEWGFEETFVTECAAFAIGKERPMLYLDKLLDSYHGKGVRTMEAARAERESFQQGLAAKAEGRYQTPARGPKTVEQQQYTQREYVHSDADVDAFMKHWQEENGNA
ncbi:MAG: DnaD domain protein [Clostridia bacterium]|nr:DnaD domain protein [Clostridia bacterium]